MPKPKVDPVDYARAKLGWFRSMFDVTALALQTDSTRLVTFQVRDSLNGTPINSSTDSNERGVPWDLHTITHNGGEEEKLRWWTKIDAWQMEDWVYFLNKLKNMREGNGTVLDHTLALWGTTNGGPAAHYKQDLPGAADGRDGSGRQARRAHRLRQQGAAGQPHPHDHRENGRAGGRPVLRRRSHRRHQGTDVRGFQESLRVGEVLLPL